MSTSDLTGSSVVTQYGIKPARALSSISLGNDRFLQINTHKSSGYLVTTAQGVRTQGNFIVFALFIDFNSRLACTDVPCTDSNVRRQHQAALVGLDGLMQRAVQFYAVLDADTALAKQGEQTAAA